MGMQLGIGKSVVGSRLHCELDMQKAVIVRTGKHVSITRCVRIDKERIKNLSVKHVECETVSSAKAYMSGIATSINAGCKPDELPMP